MRLDGFLDALGPAGLTAAQGRIASPVAHRVEAIVRKAFRELEDWQTTLRAMANQLGQLELRSKRAVIEELGIKPGALPLHRAVGRTLRQRELAAALTSPDSLAEHPSGF